MSLDAVELLRGVAPREVPVVARDAANRIASGARRSIPAQVERRILAQAALRLAQAPDHRRGSGRRPRARRPARAASAPSAVWSSKARAAATTRAASSRGRCSASWRRRRGQGRPRVLAERRARRATSSELRGLRDRSGRLLFSDGVQDEQALAGHNVYLTIDQGIQYVAERELAAAVRTFEAAGGSVVVVDPHTGEVLAMASWPAFNPNDYGTSEPECAPRLRATTDAFEPGSTVKIFTVAAGLAAGAIKPTDKLYCEKGMMPVDNVVIRDTHPAEWLTIAQVLAVSSNICAAKIGLGLGGDRLYEALRRFGFGEQTGLAAAGRVARARCARAGGPGCRSRRRRPPSVRASASPTCSSRWPPPRSPTAAS